MTRMTKTDKYAKRNAFKRERRAIMLDLLGGECIECGSKERLHFDHVIPETKLFNIATGLDYSIEKLLAEIQKCQLLCISCHSIKTITDTGKLNSHHGSVSMYMNHACRCDDCKVATSEYFKIYRKTWRLQESVI